MLEETITVGFDTLIGETTKLKLNGYRFVTISCLDLDESTFDIIYHFDKDLVLKHLRFTVAKGVAIPSISPVFLAAFLVENEIQDLYGLKFQGLAIDYGQTLYLESEQRTAPFCKYSIKHTEQDKTSSSPASEQEQ
jgi:ech hydrogenase subunit D